MEKFMKIVSLDEGLVQFNMYDFQKRLYIQYTIIDLLFANYLDSQVNQQQQLHTYYIMQYLIRIQI